MRLYLWSQKRELLLLLLVHIPLPLHLKHIPRPPHLQDRLLILALI